MGVPSNIMVPFVGVSFDSSRAFSGPATMPVNGLLIGQQLAAATAEVGTQYLVSSSDEVGQLAGFGSQIHRAARKWFANNKTTTLSVILLDDAIGATKGATEITWAGTATASGEVDFYIDGDRYAVAVATGDTAAVVGAALAAAINADPYAPVVAVYATGTLTLTAKNAGIAAGDIDTRFNYNKGEKFPAGLTIGAPTFVAGAGDPDVQTAIDGIGDSWFNIISGPYSDATNMGKMEDYLESQAGPMIQRDGLYYTAKKDTRSNLITFATGSGRNCPYVVLIAATSRPYSLGEVAAAYAARVAESITEDPAVPLHRMTLTGLLPVSVTDRWDLIERNQLAQNGIATLSDDNGVQTEATVTMYLKNSAGAADIAYQYQNTNFILMRLRYTFVARILTRYPRAKLANSADRVRAGQQIITPDIGRAEAIAWFLEQEADGQVENLKQFKAEIICRRPTGNVNRLEWILPPDLINQFIVGSADLAFRLQA